MTPLLSWMLVITVGVLGGVFAWQFARWLEDREWREWDDDLARWRAMCLEIDALSLGDLWGCLECNARFPDMGSALAHADVTGHGCDKPTHDAGEHPHRGS